MTLDYVDQMTGSAEAKQNLKGQARLLRAYYFLKLASIYCQPYANDPDNNLGISLITSSAVDDAYPSRSTLRQTYDFIESELKQAKDELKDYKPTTHYRVTAECADLLLSRLYLYEEKWDECIAEADEAIKNGPQLTDFNSLIGKDVIVYNASSSEVVWNYGGKFYDSEGNLSVLITESARPRVNPDMFECKIANKGNDIFVWSDRTGWGHIYHYDGHGRLLNPVTSGNWTAGRICAIDEKAKLLFFYGYGHEARRNPYYQHLYRVGFNGKGLKLLTPENAEHKLFVSPNCKIIVDNYSTVSEAPTIVVRDANGKKLDMLEKSDVSKLYAYGWKAPEQFKIKAADGKTDLYGLMWKPYDFDPSKKYPIISQVYPGPFTETVWNDFTVFDKYHNAALAQRGFIVVVFGHRGSSPLRSKAYNTFGYGNLRDYPLADDKAGIEQIAAKYSFVDISRVGIVGHSGGAMMAAAAIMTYPDFYKAAVASSGNYDNTVYNRMWGETYQGIADDNARFSVKTVQELAPRLKGHLMLATGDVDQNVHPIHTQRLVEALINANKDFDLLVLPGQQHHYDFTHQMYFERRKRDFFERWLK